MFPQRTRILTSSSGAVTGMKVIGFKVIADAVFTLATGTLEGYAAVTLPAGTELLCNLTAVTLASGTVAFYELV